jgi:hypothetical protein
MEEKRQFLKNKFITLLKAIPSDTKPAWGKMTLQQMTEHFADSVRIASGKQDHKEIITPNENLQRMQDFIMSDKPFRENTQNALMPETPAPVKNKSIKEAFAELQKEIDYFFEVFESNPHLTTRNPFFGDLNFDMNVNLLYKHALHHLKQFGATV